MLTLGLFWGWVSVIHQRQRSYGCRSLLCALASLVGVVLSFAHPHSRKRHSNQVAPPKFSIDLLHYHKVCLPFCLFVASPPDACFPFLSFARPSSCLWVVAALLLPSFGRHFSLSFSPCFELPSPGLGPVDPLDHLGYSRVIERITRLVVLSASSAFSLCMRLHSFGFCSSRSSSGECNTVSVRLCNLCTVRTVSFLKVWRFQAICFFLLRLFFCLAAFCFSLSLYS